MLDLIMKASSSYIKEPKVFFSVRRNSWFIAVAFGLLGATLISLKPLGFDRDCWQYLSHYKSSGSVFGSDYEVGYELVSFIAKSAGLGFSFYYFFLVFFALTIKLKLLTTSRAGWIGLLFYIAVVLPLHEYTQVRAAIGTSLGYLGVFISQRRERRIATGFALLLIAAQFHLSAAVFLLPYFCILFGVRGRSGGFFVVATAVAVFYSLLVAAEDLLFIHARISYYIDALGSEQKILTAQNFMVGFLLVVGLLGYRHIEVHDVQSWYIFSWVIYLCSILITEQMPTVAGRILELSFFAYLLWVPRLRGLTGYAAVSVILLWSSYAFYRYMFVDGVFDGYACAI